MKPLPKCIWLLAAGALTALAGEALLKDLRLILYDDAGRVTRRVTANAGSGTTAGAKLSDVVIDFFAAGKAEAEPVARLFLDAASYAPAKSLVTGDGELRFRGEKAQLTGRGYRYNIKEESATIRDGFRLEQDGVIIEGREADVKFGRVDGNVVITEFEARGHIVATGPAVTKQHLHYARSEKAWYSSRDEIAHLATPVMGLRIGDKVETELAGAELSYRLKAPKVSPATAP